MYIIGLSFWDFFSLFILKFFGEFEFFDFVGFWLVVFGVFELDFDFFDIVFCLELSLVWDFELVVCLFDVFVRNVLFGGIFWDIGGFFWGKRVWLLLGFIDIVFI